MIDSARPPGGETMQVGLLMEGAQAHQKLVEESLESLRAHARDLDAVVRDEIRRTFVEEVHLVILEAERAATTLRGITRHVGMRAALWSFLLSVGCSALPGVWLWWCTPSSTQLASLRAARDTLESNIARLQAAGGRIEWRYCGESRRLCVRVDRSVRGYGEAADFFIVKGY